MTEIAADPVPALAALVNAEAKPSEKQLSHRAAWGTFVCLSLITIAIFQQTEFLSAAELLKFNYWDPIVGASLRRDFGSFAIATGVSAALTAFLIFLTRRALFSLVSVISVVSIVIAASFVKLFHMNMHVHAYDLVFYLSSWSTLSFLWHDFKIYVLTLPLLIAAAAGLGWLVFRTDPTRVRRLAALAIFILGGGMAALGTEMRGERRHLQFFFKDIFIVSSFYGSWVETLEALWRGTLMEAAKSAPGGPLAQLNACDTSGPKPHIILIHQESIVQPSLFPALKYDRRIDSHFNSYDGKLHKMRVETYGGASWLTEFSILAGVSTHSFGGMRQFVQTMMSGKLQGTVPQELETCGYRNTVFYPMFRNFVSNTKFYNSIGMKEVFDQGDQGAKSSMERDRFYYNSTLNEMERHFGSAKQPLFAYVQTMAAHWPYDFAYPPYPGEDIPVTQDTHPELREYLRRVFMAKLDLEYFRAELKKRFPGERFLIVHYGDHHPVATRQLFGFGDEIDAEEVTLPEDHIGYITYYAVEGINFQPGELPKQEIVDVPYLGAILMQAARLPLSEANRERFRLMEACDGRYWTCARRGEILAFHRRLIDSGLMQAR